MTIDTEIKVETDWITKAKQLLNVRIEDCNEQIKKPLN